MNVFITGGTGFLGRHLLNSLINDGKINKIYVLVNKRECSIESKKIVVIKESLNTINKININDEIDCLIHLAGYWKTESKKINNEINHIGSKNVIDFSKKNGIRKIIFTSTINVKLERKGQYAKTKLMAEKEIINSGLKYIIIRPTLIYGPGDSGFSKIIDMVKKMSFVPVFGNGEKFEQPIYVYELADYIHKILYSQSWNHLIEIGGKEKFKFNELINKLAFISKNNIKIIHLPVSPFLFFTGLFEKINIYLPITSEQILHMDSNLDVDNKKAMEICEIEMDIMENNLIKYI